jgi:hypothetical protein
MIKYPFAELFFMKWKNLLLIICIFLIALFVISCEKQTEEFKTEAISDYLPLSTGKYITYRLDSTVFTNLGRTEETHKYQVKHVVDAAITDNLGRPGYRILRYLRDSAGTKPWVANGSYFITNLEDQAEVVEDNLRSIKLHIPFKLNNTWKGNRYISSDPYASLFSFSNDDNMNDWDFNVDQYDATTSIGGKQVNNVYTISHVDEALNAPVTDPRLYGARSFSLEKYSKTIGLVYRDYILWEYQPNTGGGGGGYKTGFGIKMWMIDHN